jgi:MFS family permease
MQCNPENLIFDKSLVQNSIVSDFGLTCDRLKVKNAIGSVYMVGVLIGSICVGLFADRFGRLTTLVIGAAATAISGIAGV